MRPNLPSLGLWLLMACAPAGAVGGEPWVYLGDLRFPKTGMTGRLSLNLDSLRRRARHYEVWERVVLAADAAAGGEGEERYTLWAIRCGHGAMAKVTERVAGSFEPRAEKLRFYVPAPDSVGATVIETACAEVRRGRGGNPPAPAGDGAGAGPGARAGLDYPPTLLDDEDLDEGEE